MLFQHMPQQTTHDGDTHVGYFNMAVFAVSSCYEFATFVEGTGRCFLTFVDISEVFPTMKGACILHT